MYQYQLHIGCVECHFDLVTFVFTGDGVYEKVVPALSRKGTIKMTLRLLNLRTV